MKRRIAIAVSIAALVAVGWLVAQESEPFTDAQTWSKSENYNQTPDKLIMTPGANVVWDATANLWRWSVTLQKADGTVVLITYDGVQYDSKEITCTKAQFNTAYDNATGANPMAKMQKAFRVLAKADILAHQ